MFAESVPVSPKPGLGLPAAAQQTVRLSLQSPHGFHVGTDSHQNTPVGCHQSQSDDWSGTLSGVLLHYDANHDVDLGRLHVPWKFLLLTVQV